MNGPKRTPIERSREEYDRLAEVNATDIENARATWLALAPKPLKELLDAQPESSAETEAT